MLVKEILVTLGKFTDINKEFVFQDKFFENIRISDFSIHIINSISNVYNTLERIVGKTLYF